MRSSASGASRPVRSTSWPSRTISIRRSTSVRVERSASTSATSSRIELVPQSIAATRVMPRPPRPRRRRRTGRAPPVGQRVRAPRRRAGWRPARGQRVGHQHVQALHPVRHAAGGDAGDLGDLLDRAADREVALVRVAVCGAQLVVDIQPSGHLAHHAPRPPGCRPPRPRAGRSGSKRSGTACRRAAEARSRPRPGCRTGSGAPPGVRRGRPVRAGPPRPGGRAGWAGRSLRGLRVAARGLDAAPQVGEPRAARHASVARASTAPSSGRCLVGLQHDVGLSRQA